MVERVILSEAKDLKCLLAKEILRFAQDDKTRKTGFEMSSNTSSWKSFPCEAASGLLACSNNLLKDVLEAFAAGDARESSCLVFVVCRNFRPNLIIPSDDVNRLPCCAERNSRGTAAHYGQQPSRYGGSAALVRVFRPKTIPEVATRLAHKTVVLWRIPTPAPLRPGQVLTGARIDFDYLAGA
jgi:hypothetical protein